MKKIVILLSFIMSSIVLYGQAREEGQSNVSENAKVNIGFGAGMDYGGFGTRFTFMAAEKIGIFGALGYNLIGAGFNGGITYKFNPSKRVSPTLGAMYGYNAVIKIEDGDEASKAYYGPSFSFGFEVKSKRNTLNFWNFELVIPIRPSEFQDDINALKSIGYEVTDPLPIGFSVGYHFGVN